MGAPRARPGRGGAGRLSGSDSADFSGFAAYGIGGAAYLSLTGTNALNAGQSLAVDGALVVTGSLAEAAGATIAIGPSGVLRFEGASATLAGSIVNTGALTVQGTTLTLAGPVSGAGKATIDDGTLAVEAAGFAQAVRFAGLSGVLDLARSQSFAGSVANFAAGGGDVLNLGDIAFTGAGEASFSGDAGGGILTVNDGTETASIRLIGDYLGDTFVAASDGTGGVAITAMATPAPAAHAFVAAMARMGGPAAAASGPIAAAHAADRPLLLAPRSQRA